MTDYGNMSAHEILVMAVTTAYQEDYLPIIESALRRKVIEEASVGTVSIKHHSTDKAGYPLVDKLTMKEVMPNAWMDYDLILKETSGERPY